MDTQSKSGYTIYTSPFVAAPLLWCPQKETEMLSLDRLCTYWIDDSGPFSQAHNKHIRLLPMPCQDDIQFQLIHQRNIKPNTKHKI